MCQIQSDYEAHSSQNTDNGEGLEDFEAIAKLENPDDEDPGVRLNTTDDSLQK